MTPRSVEKRYAAQNRRLNLQEETPVMSNTVKRVAANTAIKLGVVAAIVAIVAAADQLQSLTGKKWM